MKSPKIAKIQTCENYQIQSNYRRHDYQTIKYIKLSVKFSSQDVGMCYEN